MIEQEMLNEPIKCKLGGAELSFRMLSAGKRGAVAQAYFIERYIHEIKCKAKVYDDPKKQAEYIDRKMEDMPSGDKLMEAAMDLGFNDEVCIRFMKEACVEDVSELYLQKLCTAATDLEMRTVFKVMVGKKKSDGPRVTGGKSAKKSRKSTAGRSTTSGPSRKNK